MARLQQSRNGRKAKAEKFGANELKRALDAWGKVHEKPSDRFGMVKKKRKEKS